METTCSTRVLRLGLTALGALLLLGVWASTASAAQLTGGGATLRYRV